MAYRSSLDWWRPRPGKPEEVARREQMSEAVQAARITERAHMHRASAIVQACAMYGLSAGLGTSVRIGARSLTENVFAQYIDTWTSYVGRSMPRPLWMPIDGDSDATDRADLLANWSDALGRRVNIKSLRYQGIRDRALAGIDCLRPFRPAPGKPLGAKRDHPLNVVFDDALGNALPGEVFTRSLITRSTLRSVYGRGNPEIMAAIDAAPGADKTTWFTYQTNLDAVEVWECWHVDPRGEPDPGDEGDSEGLYLMGFHNCCLVAETWTFPRIPAAIGRAIPPTHGYWGNSYFDRLCSIQEELNRQTRMEQEIMHTFAIPLFFLSNGSTVAGNKLLSDGIARVITTSGPPPVPFSPSVSPDIWNRSDRRRQQMSEGFGVSQMAAQQIKPSGINTEPAFRAYADFQDMRHAFTFEEDAASMIAFTRAAMDLEVLEARRNPDHRVPCYRGEGGFATYRWEDVYLDEERGMLAVMPAGIITGTVTEQLQRIGELRALGLIDDQMAQRLIDAPDYKRARALATAPEDNIMRRLDAICRGENPEKWKAEPHLDMALARRLWGLRMNRAEADQRPDHVLDNMRTWRANLQDLIARMNRRAQKSTDEVEALGYDTQAAEAQGQITPQVTPESGAIPNPMQAPGTLGLPASAGQIMRSA